MSSSDINQLKLILQHIEQQDANGRPIKYAATKEFRKLLHGQKMADIQKINSQKIRQIDTDIINITYSIIQNVKERLHSRLYALKFVTSCLLEGNILFIETFQDHDIMDYFADVAQVHTIGCDETNFGTMFLNDNNPTSVEQQNSQNFVRMLLECCAILSQLYPIRQNKQRSVSKFRELVDTMKQSGCFIPSDRKIQTQDLNAIQNALVDQNYVGSASNGAQQQDYHQQNAQQTLGQSQLNQQGSKNQLNQSQANKGATPQPPLTESMATRIKGLTADDYNRQYKENLKLLEQIRQQCVGTVDFPQYIDSFIKKINDYKKIFDTCNVSDEEIQNKSAMISIVDQEVLDSLQGYQSHQNPDNLVNYFLVQYEQTYTGFLGEPLPNDQQQQGQKSDKDTQRKKEEQRQKELEQQRRLEEEQRELEELQNERHQQMLQRKEDDKRRREEEEANWKKQQAQDEYRQQQEQQKLLLKQKEEELHKQQELERQQQIIKKQKEEEQERQRQLERQKEQEKQQQLQKKQKEEELERQRQIEKQLEYENQQQQSLIRNQQPQSNQYNKHNKFEEDIDEGIYTGYPQHSQVNKNTLDHNIYQTRQHKVPSVIEEENEDYTQSNRNLSQLRPDMNQSGKKFHHSMYQSNFNKSSIEMKNSKFQAALNQMADMERSKLRESRISARSHYEIEKSHSLSRLDPNKSKPIITKGISREEHKTAINKEKEEQHRLEKVIFSKEAEINSQKDAMKLMTKEMIEQKTICDHLEKDILKYQQKIQLYEQGNSHENDKFIQQINLLEKENNEQQINIAQLEENNQSLIQQKLFLEETLNQQNFDKQQLEQKYERLENDLEQEKQRQKQLENRITERLSNNQSQLEKEVTQLTIEKSTLEGQLRNQKEDYENLQKHFNQLNQDILHIRNDYAEYRAQVESDQQHLDKKSSKSLKQLEEYEHLAQELRNQTQKLSDENKKLFEKNKLQAKDLETKDLEIETLNDKIMSLENDRLNNQELRFDNQIKTTNENHKYIEMRQKWQEEKNLHQENLNKFKKEMKTLKDQNEELTAQLIESQSQVQDVKNQLVLQRNTHNEEMSKFLAENTKHLGNEIGEKDEHINQIQRELIQKNKLLEEGKFHYEQQLVQEQSKVTSSNQRIVQLEKELQETYNLLQDVSIKNNEQQTVQYKLQLDKLQEDALKQNKLNQEQNELIFQIHKDLNQEKKQNEELKQKYALLNDEFNRINQYTAQLENDKQHSQIQLQKLQLEHNNLQREFEELKQKYQASSKPDVELVEKIDELQQVNAQLQGRIEQLMLEASQHQQIEQSAAVQAPQKFEKSDRMYNAYKPAEVGGEQDADNIISNSMLSDARRINDCLDDTNKEPKQLSAFKQYENSAQRQPYHQQQNPVRLSEMGRKNQFYSPESRQQPQSRNISQDPQYHLNQLGNFQTTMPHKVSPKYFEAQDNFETIPVKYAQDMRQIDPESAALIFPFQNPIHYYENKAPKIVKGKLVRNDYNTFNYLPTNPQIQYRFKRGCLKENFPLFQNEEIQIGVISKLLSEDRADILEIVLYFTNRTEDIITDFQLYYNPGKTNTIEMEPQELDTELLPGVQKSQRLLIGINEIPFEVILLDFSYRIRYQTKRFNVAIPNTINKFFEPKVIDISTFKYLWGNCKEQIYRSEDIQLDEKVAKSSFDFLNYFKNFMEINETKQQDYMLGLNETKVGGCFQLKASNTSFLMKVSVGPNGQAIFQVALLDQPIDHLQNCVLEHIIQTFSLIFRSEQ